jgi:hypothetical protein
MFLRSECKNRVLYRIRSRNLSFGVFREETGGFIGLREKQGHIYAFEEYHWDNGPPYGTVTPLEELPEVLPDKILLTLELGSICSECRKTCEYVKFPDGEREKIYPDGHKMMTQGEWKHLESTECQEVRPMSVGNRAIERWLRRMEKKYRAG